ncbi:fatty acid--CoA ligase [Aquabacterium sp.]|uniref:fatty acid--CoA ligase n=1 Tax=Aquabacterium sp. TaxID=1872578 RepID=UPI004037A835
MQPSTPFSSPYAYPLLIKQLLHTPLLNAADQEIVYKDARRHTYRDFATRVAKLANVLASQGVKPGDTVAVMDWDSHRYLEAYFAIPMMGATLMTVNIRLSQEQIAYTVDHAGASVLLVHEDFLPMVESMQVRLPKVGCMVLLRDSDAVDGGEDYESQMARASGYHDFQEFDENTRATTFYTTGTTGLPKAVYFSHRQLVLHTLATATGLSASPEAQRFHRGDVYMPLTPMFHVHAWGLPYVATLLGVKQVYPGRYVPATVIELIRREGVTFSHGVPTVLQMVLDAAGDLRLDGWKVVAGGSVLPPGLCRQALAKGIDIFTGYGMSETCPMMTLAQKPAHATATSSHDEEGFRMRAGWAVPLVELRIVDEHMCDVPHDDHTPGEVVVRAPWLTQGYRDNQAATEALWQGGYLHTNDIGRMDGTGALRLIDRLKDVIKTGGEWVSSLDLEHLLSAHPGVAEVAVIGVPHEHWGERPMAIVKPRPEFTDTLTEEELRQMVTRLADQGVVPKYAVPDQVRFVEAIDRTSVGKFDKKALRLKFASA